MASMKIIFAILILIAGIGCIIYSAITDPIAVMTGISSALILTAISCLVKKMKLIDQCDDSFGCVTGWFKRGGFYRVNAGINGPNVLLKSFRPISEEREMIV